MAYQNDRITGIPAPLPKDYDRGFSFTDYQTINPGDPMPGASLDNEFAGIEQSLDETQARARLIQRDDGALKNGIVDSDALADSSVGLKQLKPESYNALSGTGVIQLSDITSLSSLSSLNTSVLVDGQQFYRGEFWPDTGVGAVNIKWDPNEPVANHNGGTIIDPAKISELNTTTKTFGTYFTPDTVSGNTGCFVVDEKRFSFPMFGATVGGSISFLESVENTKALQACFDALAISGGEIYDDGFEYLVGKESPSGGGSTTPEDYALHFYGSDCSLCGVRGKSKITAHPDAPSRFVVIRWMPLPIVNGQILYSNSHIKGFIFDGGYTVIPDGALGEYSVVLWHGLEDSSIKECVFMNSEHYCLGMQNGGHKNCTIHDVDLFNSMHDGLDVKNNGDSDSGNVIDLVRVRNFGLAVNPTAPFAGLDVMGQWEISNVRAYDYGEYGDAAAGVRFKQGEAGESRGSGGHNGSLVGFSVVATEKAVDTIATVNASGVFSQARGVKVSSGYVSAPNAAGVRFIQRSCKASNILSEGSDYGFQTSDSAYPTNGDQCSFVNCEARDSVSADFRTETSNNSYSGCVSDGGDTGWSITSGATLNSWSGGSIGNNATANISNTGGFANKNSMSSCSGVRTKGSFTVDVPIDTTGNKSFSIPHDLFETPRESDVSLTLIRSSNNAPWSVGRLAIILASSSDIAGTINISSASTEPGDVVTVAASVDCEYLQ